MLSSVLGACQHAKSIHTCTAICLGIVSRGPLHDHLQQRPALLEPHTRGSTCFDGTSASSNSPANAWALCPARMQDSLNRSQTAGLSSTIHAAVPGPQAQYSCSHNCKSPRPAQARSADLLEHAWRCLLKLLMPKCFRVLLPSTASLKLQASAAHIQHAASGRVLARTSLRACSAQGGKTSPKGRLLSIQRAAHLKP